MVRLSRSSAWSLHLRQQTLALLSLEVSCASSSLKSLHTSVVSFVFPLKCLSTAVSSCLRGAASPSSVCLHETALGCLRGGREGRRWRRCSACWSKGEFGVHWGGDRGRRWSLKEAQAHLLGAMRRRQGSKAAVGTSIRGEGQGQRGGSGRLLGRAPQEAIDQRAGVGSRRALQHGKRGPRVENLHDHRCHARAVAVLPLAGTPRRNPSCPL